MTVTIYHNPRCSKSRQTLALLEERGLEPEVVLYLEDPPTKARLKQIVKMLGGASARDLMRVKEAPYHDLDSAVSDELKAEIEALSKGIIDGSVSVKG